MIAGIAVGRHEDARDGRLLRSNILRGRRVCGRRGFASLVTAGKMLLSRRNCCFGLLISVGLGLLHRQSQCMPKPTVLHLKFCEFGLCGPWSLSVWSLDLGGEEQIPGRGRSGRVGALLIIGPTISTERPLIITFQLSEGQSDLLGFVEDEPFSAGRNYRPWRLSVVASREVDPLEWMTFHCSM